MPCGLSPAWSRGSPFHSLACEQMQMRISTDTWRKVFDRDKGFCRYCGADLLLSYSTFGSSHLDHVVSRCVGGTDEPSNLVLACGCCNTILSRASHLRTVRARKEYVQRQLTDHHHWYTLLRFRLKMRNSILTAIPHPQPLSRRARGASSETGGSSDFEMVDGCRAGHHPLRAGEVPFIR